MRTESDKLAMTPLCVTLGTTEYQLPILRTLKMRDWRQKLMETLGPTLGCFGIQVSEGGEEGVKGGLIQALLRVPEKVADLLFEYSPDLPKDTILAECTEEQLVAVFLEVISVAYPFLGALTFVKTIVNSELSALQSQGSSRLQ